MLRFTLMLSPTNSPVFPVRYAPRHPNKLAFTSLHCSISNYTFDRRDSDLINLLTNMIQINIRQSICNLRPQMRSDQICNARKQNIPGLIDVLIAICYLRSWANAVFQNRGLCGQAFPSLPSPSPLIPCFFALLPTFSTNSRGNACYAGYFFRFQGIYNPIPASFF